MTQSFFSTFILLILVTDPFGNVPLFAAALKDTPLERRNRIVIRECAIAFMFFGKHFLEALHLSPIALRIGGAVILLMIAIRMIFPHPDGVLGKSEGGEPFIVPLAIPALAGPSALATVLLLSATSFTETMVHVAALAAVGIVWLAVFLSAEKLQQKLGPQVMTAFERLMGLILTAMAVEMLLGGIREFVRTL
jgi:small neutral amino acid transporter SnatA (MarC family)